MDKKNYLLPISILIAAVLISVSLLYNAGDNGSGTSATGEKESPLNNIIPIESVDHVRGNPDADIVIFEYSDFECTFCKSFHTTMQRVIDEYGASGEVAWVYRHFPVHQKAPTEALATECAASLGGNDAFWNYADMLFERTELNDQTDLSILPEIAGEIGLDVSEFQACLDSAEFNDKIIRDARNAVDTGGGGTPWNVVLTKDGEVTSINGAQPYPVVQSLIESLLQ